MESGEVVAPPARGRAALRRPARRRRAGPRPEHRFPLPERPGPRGPSAGPPRRRPPAAPPDLPHWTEPPTGEVPRIFADVAPETESTGDDEDDDFGAWSRCPASPAGGTRRPTGTRADFDDASVLADDETASARSTRSRTEHSDLFSFDEHEPSRPPDATGTAPIRTGRRLSGGPSAAGAAHAVGDRACGGARPGGGSRDVQTAVLTGVGAAVVALLCFKLGTGPTLVLATRRRDGGARSSSSTSCGAAGYHPATLLGPGRHRRRSWSPPTTRARRPSRWSSP